MTDAGVKAGDVPGSMLGVHLPSRRRILSTGSFFAHIDIEFVDGGARWPNVSLTTMWLKLPLPKSQVYSPYRLVGLYRSVGTLGGGLDGVKPLAAAYGPRLPRDNLGLSACPAVELNRWASSKCTTRTCTDWSV